MFDVNRLKQHWKRTIQAVSQTTIDLHNAILIFFQEAQVSKAEPEEETVFRLRFSSHLARQLQILFSGYFVFWEQGSRWNVTGLVMDEVPRRHERFTSDEPRCRNFLIRRFFRDCGRA